MQGAPSSSQRSLSSVTLSPPHPTCMGRTGPFTCHQMQLQTAPRRSSARTRAGFDMVCLLIGTSVLWTPQLGEGWFGSMPGRRAGFH